MARAFGPRLWARIQFHPGAKRPANQPKPHSSASRMNHYDFFRVSAPDAGTNSGAWAGVFLVHLGVTYLEPGIILRSARIDSRKGI